MDRILHQLTVMLAGGCVTLIYFVSFYSPANTSAWGDSSPATTLTQNLSEE